MVENQEELNMKLGFIGFGNMAKAITKGIIKNDLYKPAEICYSHQTATPVQSIYDEYKITHLETNQQVWDESEIIILAVKPHQLRSVLMGLDRTKSPLVISIAAGVTTDFYEDYLNKDSYLRTMPNLNSQVLEGMTAIVKNEHIGNKSMKVAISIFESIGKVVTLEESELSVFTAIAGSSPALTFLFIDMLARTAVKHGMKKDTATEIAAQAVLGSGKTVLDSHSTPWSLIDQVSSPGGVTVDGVLSLLEDDFSKSVIQAVDKMVDKNENMG